MGQPQSESEKGSLPISLAVPQPDSKRASISSKMLFALLAVLGLYGMIHLVPSYSGLKSLSHHHGHKHHGHKDQKSKSCVQAEPVLPQAFDVAELIPGKEARIRDWLSGAVKIPTEVFDVMGPIGEDKRWDVFYDFASYLEKSFPLVHQHLNRTRVMTHALIYEWQGSDASLKPLMITGHQDVVPVLAATRDQWTHDPFGGEYEESTDLIWGRGSSDDKSGTIGVLAAIELLLESGKFKPTRTVVLAFGIDEETGGKVGAMNLGIWLEEKYGKDSMAILVDEGTGLVDVWGQIYATPAVAEKGYLDVEIKVETPGGHSSVPPAHTGIGLISQFIAALERNPHSPYLNVESPLVTFISCAADYAPKIPSKLKRAIRRVEASISGKHAKKGKVDKKALKEVEDWWVEGSAKDHTLLPGMGKAMVSTTQAVDIINGGVKVNALPEVVTAVVNHRINLASSVGELEDRIARIFKPVASKYNIALEAFGKDIELEGCPHYLSQPKLGKVIVSEAWNSSLEPAPVSPHTVDDPAWRVFAGTIKGVYATRPGGNFTDAEKVVEIAPTISPGNTDTKRYWNLTRAIYRFAYQTEDPKGGLGNIHTVDEHMSASVFIEQVRWFMTFIVNVDETREV